MAALKTALHQNLANLNNTGKAAKLEVLVTKAQIITAGKRAVIGAFGGSNLLFVTATVRSPDDNQVLAVFDIKGDYNPGGFGAFTDPEVSTAENVAKALVEEIYKN